MSQGFFTNLPSTFTIVSYPLRLPTRTIVHCKCVCKSWLDLLKTGEFSKHHLSRSVPGLAVFLYGFSGKLHIYEFEDELDLEHHELHYKPITSFCLPILGSVQRSASGWLLLRDHNIHNIGADSLYICNPITHECVQLDFPQDFAYAYPQVVSFGFGTSRITGQHKVVRIFHELTLDQESSQWEITPISECQVYALRTGSWRNIAPSAPFVYKSTAIGAFLNGNLHWFVLDIHLSPWISCFDHETELWRNMGSKNLGLRNL